MLYTSYKRLNVVRTPLVLYNRHIKKGPPSVILVYSMHLKEHPKHLQYFHMIFGHAELFVYNFF